MLKDPTRSGLVAQAFAQGLVQPDPTTCGSSVLVLARMLNDPAYAEFVTHGSHPVTGFATFGSVTDRFRAEALAMHRRTNLPVDIRGHLQLPWLRRFGTAPWAVARQLSGGAGVPGTTYRTRLILPHRRGEVFDRIVGAVRAGHVIPLYVGNRLLPRHVVLVVAADDQHLLIYEPSAGRRVTLTKDAFVRAELSAGGWKVPWCGVLPPQPTRGSPA